MKIKVIASVPEQGQTGVSHLIGKEFETVPYSLFWDRDIIQEMKDIGEVGIVEEGQQRPTILNKDEYIKIQ